MDHTVSNAGPQHHPLNMKLLVVVLALLGCAAAQTSPFDAQALASVQRSGAKAAAVAESARAQAEALIASLTAALNEATANLETVVNFVSSNSVANLSPSLIANATDVINACLATQAAAVVNATRESAREVVACFTDKIKEARDMLADVIALGRQAVDLAPTAVAAINACPAPLLQRVSCLVVVVAGATADSIKIVADVASIVARGSAMVTTIQVDLQTCVALKISKFVLKAMTVATDFGICIFVRP